MNPRTAARLAWGVAILSYAILAACLVLLWLERTTIASVGAGPVGDIVPTATLGALGALIASRALNLPDARSTAETLKVGQMRWMSWSM